MEAVDSDVANDGSVMRYYKVEETTGNYFHVDLSTGIVRNRALLRDIRSRQPVLSVQADDNGDQPNTNGSVSRTVVKVGWCLVCSHTYGTL